MTTGGAGMYRYRCGQCRSTSPSVLTRDALARERHLHRMLFHGGHVPDGEAVMKPAPFRFSALPREQRVVGTLLVLLITAGILARFL